MESTEDFTRWEYQMLQQPFSSDHFESILNNWGFHGWEVVTIEFTKMHPGTYVRVIFKRPYQLNPSSVKELQNE